MVDISGSYGKLKRWVNRKIATIVLSSLADVDDTNKANDKILQYKSATEKHEYVDPPSGYTDADAIAAARKIVLYTSTKDIYRCDDVCDSSFNALINGAPSTTSVVYDTVAREKSLPDTATRPQFGKVILHNITRGNSRKITGVNKATNTITTDSSTDNWADNDIITIGSQTCSYLAAHPHSRYFDIDVSDQVPANAVVIIINFMVINNSITTVGGTNSAGLHPFESYASPKYNGCFAAVGSEHETKTLILPLNNQKICVAAGAYGAIGAAGVKMILRINGWWIE